MMRVTKSEKLGGNQNVFSFIKGKKDNDLNSIHTEIAKESIKNANSVITTITE